MSNATAYRLEINQYNMQFVNLETGKAETLFYRIDPTAKPKTIDLHSGTRAGPGSEEITALGIYEIEGDLLKICLADYLPSLKADQRPKDFTIEPGSNKAVITLQRYQPSADEKALMGKWNLTGENGDEKAIVNGRWENILSLSFSDYRCRFENGSLGTFNVLDIWRDCIYVIDPDKDPKQIKIYPTNPGLRPGQDPLRSIAYGIYKIDGDRLRIAYRRGGPAPEKFESAPGSGITLLELQRERAKKRGTGGNKNNRTKISRPNRRNRGRIRRKTKKNK